MMSRVLVRGYVEVKRLVNNYHHHSESCNPYGSVANSFETTFNNSDSMPNLFCAVISQSLTQFLAISVAANKLATCHILFLC